MASIPPAFPRRHAISRAYFFLVQAESCSINEADACEAFLEAAIVFGRAALNRVNKQFHARPGWKDWFDPFHHDPSVEFLCEHRNHILKEAPPQVHQIIGGVPARAAQMYYYEAQDVAADVTIRRHLNAVANIVANAEENFHTQS